MENCFLPEIPTSNKMGCVSQILTEEEQLFLQRICTLPSAVVLDIGTGHGVMTLPALSRGCRVVANDLEASHLDILKNKVPSHLFSHLTLCQGKFPQEISFPENHFDAIVMMQVLHFLTGEEIEQGTPLLYYWLKPGGKIFITAITPYIGILEKFLPVYQKRKSLNLEWPGQEDHIKKYSDHPSMKFNPDFIHVFEPDILERIFLKAGFMIEKVWFCPIPLEVDPAFRKDGRECVGLMASKPLLS